MIRAACLLALSAACGRIYFDPIGEGGSPDSPGSGSDATCENVRDIAIGQTLADESLAGAGNDYAYQGCPDGVDVLYRLTLPAPQQLTLTITPTFNGSISWSGTSCPPMLAGGTCVSYSEGSTYMRMVPAGPTTLYIMIERTTGTGSTFSLAVQ